MPIAFKPRQIWTYRTRTGEPDSFLCVLAVDEENPTLGPVCSIAIARVIIANPGMANGIQDMLPHAPITAAVLEQSVIACVATDGPDATDPSVSDAYREWREPFLRQEAGVFTISPAEILDIIEGVVSGSIDERMQ